MSPPDGSSKIDALVDRIDRLIAVMCGDRDPGTPIHVDQMLSIEQVAEILRKRFKIAEGEPETFRIYTSKFAGKAAIKAKRMLGVYIMLAAVVVLLVAAVVISSIMLVVVQERIAEIGLRKAVGATRRSIAAQFLCESTIVSLIAGVAGIALGLAVASAIAHRYDIPLNLTPLAVSLAVLASVLVGIVSGIIPARQAANLDPVKALR